jgi:hypothetical protein
MVRSRVVGTSSRSRSAVSGAVAPSAVWAIWKLTPSITLLASMARAWLPPSRPKPSTTSVGRTSMTAPRETVPSPRSRRVPPSSSTLSTNTCPPLVTTCTATGSGVTLRRRTSSMRSETTKSVAVSRITAPATPGVGAISGPLVASTSRRPRVEPAASSTRVPSSPSTTESDVGRSSSTAWRRVARRKMPSGFSPVTDRRPARPLAE